jgi:hypothetical protein
VNAPKKSHYRDPRRAANFHGRANRHLPAPPPSTTPRVTFGGGKPPKRGCLTGLVLVAGTTWGAGELVVRALAGAS